MANEFLNFQAISQAVPFKDVLDWLNVDYESRNGELRGDSFIVNLQKQLFFNPHNSEEKGGIINFVAREKGVDLREAALIIKNRFLAEPLKEPKRPIPELTLTYHPFLKERRITEETAKLFEVGYCGTKSIMAGKIAVKIIDERGEKVAYVGRNLKDDKKPYFFPKGYKQDFVYNFHRVNTPYVILTVSPFDVMHFHQLGFPYTVGLLSHSMSQRQEELMGRFKRILLIHPKPENIIQRLCLNSFLKAVKVNSARTELDAAEKIKALF